jgi:hypothetical protein
MTDHGTTKTHIYDTTSSYTTVVPTAVTAKPTEVDPIVHPTTVYETKPIVITTTTCPVFYTTYTSSAVIHTSAVTETNIITYTTTTVCPTVIYPTSAQSTTLYVTKSCPTCPHETSTVVASPPPPPQSLPPVPVLSPVPTSDPPYPTGPVPTPVIPIYSTLTISPLASTYPGITAAPFLGAASDNKPALAVVAGALALFALF